jgi:hypothetical protein
VSGTGPPSPTLPPDDRPPAADPLNYATPQPNQARDVDGAGCLAVVLAFAGVGALFVGARLLLAGVTAGRQVPGIVVLFGAVAIVFGVLMLTPAVWWWLRED